MASQIIAIDYGLKRVGIAVGNTLTKSSEPLETLVNTNEEELISQLSKIIKEWQPKQLVMGMPYNPNLKDVNTITKKARKLEHKIRNFAIRLGESVELPIEFIDESFSSAEASRQLKQSRQLGERKTSIKKEDIDKAAACVILQRWLDTQA